jgi:hypothetical protein
MPTGKYVAIFGKNLEKKFSNCKILVIKFLDPEVDPEKDPKLDTEPDPELDPGLDPEPEPEQDPDPH